MVEQYPTDEKAGGRWARFKAVAFKKQNLVYWTLAGVVVGIALGAGLYGVHPSQRAIDLIGYPGELMLRALQMLVLPLIALALTTGVLSLRHSASGAARVASWSIAYYMLSMVFAVALGVAMSYAVRPGRSQPFTADSACGKKNEAIVATKSSTADGDTVTSLLNIGREMLPTNIVGAAADSKYLGIMVFAMLFGGMLSSLGPRAEPLIELLEVSNEVIMLMIWVVIYTTPVGVASMIAATILKACNIGLLLKALGLYVATVLGGFLIHSIVTLPLLMLLLARINPLRVLRAFFPAFAMGFGTSSSAATMPVTMQCAIDFGCRESITKFVIPLGTNVNRDGAALYEAASVIFIAQAHGLHLSVGSVIVVAITATLAAIGAASIPMSALVSMITVLQAVGMQAYIPDLSVILACDWLLGMFRTVVNIWGDGSAVAVVDKWASNYEKRMDIDPLAGIPGQKGSGEVDVEDSAGGMPYTTKV